MPSLEAARPVDILVLAPALVSADILALAAAFGPFCSAAQEGVAAAKAIAPTTPSMSGSFITALFMVAPPVPRPTMGHGRARETWPSVVGSLRDPQVRSACRAPRVCAAIR